MTVYVCAECGKRDFLITPHRSFAKFCSLRRPQTAELRTVAQSWQSWCKNEWAMDNDDEEENKNEECPSEEVRN